MVTRVTPTCATAPADDRAAASLSGALLSRGTMIVGTPKAAEERMIAPRLWGSVT